MLSQADYDHSHADTATRGIYLTETALDLYVKPNSPMSGNASPGFRVVALDGSNVRWFLQPCFCTLRV